MRLKYKCRQLVSPSLAAQGFSPRLSTDGSLIYSKGEPPCKQSAPQEDFIVLVRFSAVIVRKHI